MINYDLPKEIEVGGLVYPITKSGDYRLILDIITALNDDELSEEERAIVCLMMFYGEIPENPQEAISKMMWFINCGEDAKDKLDNKPPVMDWEQDFPLLIAPINKVAGIEIRSADYIHWWTFVSWYMEIGECTFSNVVSIRQKRQKGMKLDKTEQDFFRENADKVLLKNRLNQDDLDFLDEE